MILGLLAFTRLSVRELPEVESGEKQLSLLDEEDDAATAAIYLGRVLRRQDRLSEALAVLNATNRVLGNYLATR